jgi:nucleotide-binding universal stress UspA family protein
VPGTDGDRPVPGDTRSMAAVGKRILIAYDGSDTGRRALDRAAEIAGYATSLTVVPVTAGDGARPLSLEALDELARRHLHAAVREPGGDPATAVVDAAADVGADLIILGTCGNGGPEPDPVGARVVRDAPCDVMVVR